MKQQEKRLKHLEKEPKLGRHSNTMQDGVHNGRKARKRFQTSPSSLVNTLIHTPSSEIVLVHMCMLEATSGVLLGLFTLVKFAALD